MKKLFIIFLLSAITQFSPAQSSAENYSTYKPCTECFDQWHKTNLDSYGIAEQPHSQKEKQDNWAKQQGRNFISGIIAIVAAALTYVAYSKIIEGLNK